MEVAPSSPFLPLASTKIPAGLRVTGSTRQTRTACVRFSLPTFAPGTLLMVNDGTPSDGGATPAASPVRFQLS